MKQSVPGGGKTIASLVCGVLSVILVWFGYTVFLSIILGIAAIVLAVKVRRTLSATERLPATIGLAVGIAGVALSGAYLLFLIVFAGILATMTFSL